MNTTVEQALGETLRTVRKRTGLTQESAGQILGVSQATLSRWESGTQTPTASELVCAATLYGTTPAKLYTKQVRDAVPDSIRDRARRLEREIKQRQGR